LNVRPELWQTTLLGNGSPDLPRLLTEAVQSMTGPCHLAAFLLVPVLVAWLIGYGAWTWTSIGRVGDGGQRLALAALIVGSGLILGLSPFAVETVPGTMNMLRSRYLSVRFGLAFAAAKPLP